MRKESHHSYSCWFVTKIRSDHSIRLHVWCVDCILRGHLRSFLKTQLGPFVGSEHPEIKKGAVDVEPGDF